MAAGNEVTLPDITAANGVIHGIDGVITDVTGAPKEDMDMNIGNIPAVLNGSHAVHFSTLLAAVTAADLTGALDSAGPFTVFAPTNEAFAKYLTAAGTDTTSPPHLLFR
jgi:transforming growth factor-beta-induced protein